MEINDAKQQRGQPVAMHSLPNKVMSLSPMTLYLLHGLVFGAVLFVSILASVPAIADTAPPKNYCSDQQTKHAWEAGYAKNKENTAWLYMYKARKDICSAIDAGNISLADGIQQFEEARRQAMIILLKEREANKMNR